VKVLAGRVTRRQQDVIEDPLVENRMLLRKIGKKRILLNKQPRRRLAAKGKTLGWRRLELVAGIAGPETILRWHREVVGQNWDYRRRLSIWYWGPLRKTLARAASASRALPRISEA